MTPTINREDMNEYEKGKRIDELAYCHVRYHFEPKHPDDPIYMKRYNFWSKVMEEVWQELPNY